jgi:hypothetical protein
MYITKIAAIALFISVILGAMGFSHKIVENFLFIQQTPDTIDVNPNILQHSIILPDSADKTKREEQLVKKLCSKNESIVKNIIAYGDVSKWSVWIHPKYPSESHIDDINRQFFYYVKKKLSDLKLIFYKLKKYRYDVSHHKDILLDYDIVGYDEMAKCAWHIKVVCVINTSNKRVHFINISLTGSISEHNIYSDSNASNNSNNSENVWVEHNVANMYDNTANNDLMYQDNCLAMQTQDQQMHKLMYNKLMQVPNEADLQNVQYDKNQNIIKKMFLSKIWQGYGKTREYDKVKCYPYDNDFTLKFT